MRFGAEGKNICLPLFSGLFEMFQERFQQNDARPWSVIHFKDNDIMWRPPSISSTEGFHCSMVMSHDISTSFLGVVVVLWVVGGGCHLGSPNNLTKNLHQVIIPRDGEQHFYLVRNEDRNQAFWSWWIKPITAGCKRHVKRLDDTGYIIHIGFDPALVHRVELHPHTFHTIVWSFFQAPFATTVKQKRVQNECLLCR